MSFATDPALATPIPSLEEIGKPINSPIQEGPPDIITGLLPKAGQVVIAGETNVGKSLVALELCSALTTDRPLWGELRPNEKSKRIVYFLGEHYVEVIQRLAIKTQLPLSSDVWILGPEQLGFDKWLVVNGRMNIPAFQKFKKWSQGADLVVFDPLSAFISGAGDSENDNIQMRLVMDTMSLVAQNANASCLVLAHQGKPFMDKNGQEHHRRSYAIRGASGIEDAATNIFYMNEFHTDSKSALATKDERDGKIYELVTRKYKGDAPASYKLLRDPDNLTHTLLGNRPSVELKKIAAQNKFGVLSAALPEGTPKSVIYKAVGALLGVEERTVRGYLSGDEAKE